MLKAASIARCGDSHSCARLCASLASCSPMRLALTQDKPVRQRGILELSQTSSSREFREKCGLTACYLYM